MNFVGVDLHKKSITVCVMNETFKVLETRRFFCDETTLIAVFFERLGECQVAVEATASYEWFLRLVEPFAKRLVLAHPKKLRVIAESTRKSDKLDARVLAEFLARDMLPESYCPTPRQRDHRRLVRHRQWLTKRSTALKNRIHRVLADYNTSLSGGFARIKQDWLDQLPLSDVDRFVLDDLRGELERIRAALRKVNRKLAEFAKEGNEVETENREILRSIPQVGAVTTEVVLSELADPARFSSGKKATAYAGMAPGQRESAGKRQELHIEKNGSRMLRWALVEAAWRIVRKSPHWFGVYERLRPRMGKKRAIVAIARRLLCVMISMLKSRQRYREPVPVPAAAAG